MILEQQGEKKKACLIFFIMLSLVLLSDCQRMINGTEIIWRFSKICFQILFFLSLIKLAGFIYTLFLW